MLLQLHYLCVFLQAVLSATASTTGTNDWHMQLVGGGARGKAGHDVDFLLWRQAPPGVEAAAHAAATTTTAQAAGTPQQSHEEEALQSTHHHVWLPSSTSPSSSSSAGLEGYEQIVVQLRDELVRRGEAMGRL